MRDGEWQEILYAAQGSKYQNVIDTIKDKLKAEHRSVYEEWEGSGFDLNYPFAFQSRYIDNQCTLLHIFVYYSLGKVVNVLLENGANIDALDSRYMATPLHWAARFGSKDVAEILLKEGANINATDKDQATPLHRAAGSDNADIVKALLEKRAEVNAIDNVYEATPLHWAAGSGDANIVKALLARGAEINAVDQGGYAPLHYAAENDRKRVIKALLKRGADPLLRNNYGKIPRDLAQKSNIKQILKQSERKIPFKPIIVSSCFATVFGTVIAVWFIVHRGISVRKAPGVYTFALVAAMVVGVLTYKTLNTFISTGPSTRIDRAQAVRGEEQLQELQYGNVLHVR
ncbi:ankyrin repeat domain-containing protein [Wolbachia endosymbiont of Pentalonia nigronervosa]|jgi:hypothetical protein|uniref:ankyrin repeat domain-containing protein n=1 Tax=Wolbachia endosymbiont of Pentalonia nigronervosa TaxID=1301914 RepID=UPI00165F31BE|nr:ankyrin repeat domain-containing protein [Wolbachia endosymbiont of Pentalonia nigronervosa]MBD0391042.1 ankyrin repeat domain-containing protein [Wolbachia endosymbiont of Pentalonia nigronervosa]